MANGAELGKYYIQIVPTTEGISGSIESALDKGSSGAEKAGASMGSKLASGFGAAAKAIGTTMVAGTAAAVTATSKMIKETAEFGDKIDKASQKLGISAEAYQEWDFIAQHSGTSMDSLTTSFRIMQVAAAEGAEEFQALGIAAEDVASMSTEDLFAAVISGLQGMDEGAERTALATKLLGRGSMELGALLNTSAEDTEAMRKQIHKLGGVMSSSAVKGAARFQDSLQDMQTAAGGLVRNFATTFLPGIADVMDGLAAIISGDAGGIAKLQAGISSFATNLLSLLPQLVEAIKPVFEGLLQSIIDNLPMILEVGIQLVTFVIELLPQLLTQIVEAFPTILPILITGAVNLIMAFVSHMPEIILAIVQAMPGIVTTIVETLLDNLPILIQGAIQLVAGLVAALPEILMKIWETIKGVFKTIFKKLGQFITDSWEAIKDVFKRAFNAIIWLLNKTIDGVNVILTPLRAIIWGVGGLFGLNWSLDEVAIPHIPLLANGGILKEGRAIVGEKGPELLEVYGGQAKVTPLSAGDRTDIGAITINVYAAEGQDPRSIAEAVSEELARAYQRKAAVFA